MLAVSEDSKEKYVENNEELKEDVKESSEYQFERLLNVFDMLGSLLKRVQVKTDFAIFLTNASEDSRMDDDTSKVESISLEDRLEALEYKTVETRTNKIYIF